MKLHASSWICMHSANILLHSAYILETSGTFYIHSGTLWNILEYSIYILEHYAYILEDSWTFYIHSRTFWNILEHSAYIQAFYAYIECCKKVEFQIGTHTHGQTDIKTCWAASSQPKTEWFDVDEAPWHTFRGRLIEASLPSPPSTPPHQNCKKTLPQSSPHL